jgi:hypothetical protein
VSNDGIINALETAWTEAIMTEFEVLFRNFSEENHKNKTSAKVVDITAEIRVEHLLKTKQRRYSLSQLARYMMCRLLLCRSCKQVAGEEIRKQSEEAAL